jgi:hypothetical protein
MLQRIRCSTKLLLPRSSKIVQASHSLSSQDYATTATFSSKNNTAPDLQHLQPTITSRCLISTQIEKEFAVPLSITDVHLRHEQLPFAYFFDEVMSNAELEASFTETLKHFSTTGGRLANYQNIRCSPGDTVPLTFAEIDMTMDEWLSGQRGHHHQSGNGQHPTLMPLFRPLFCNSDIDSDSQNNLMTAQVTHFSEQSGTVIGVNANHILGDTASCVRFVECWGRAHCQTSFGVPSLDRAGLSCSGMMEPDVIDLLGIDNSGEEVMKNDNTPSWWSSLFRASCEFEEKEVHEPINHEYVALSFPSAVLDAMKDHGMESCESGNKDERTHEINTAYISTNDTIMAVAWLFKRSLSNDHGSHLSIVLNLRGKCGINDFNDTKDYLNANEKAITSKSGLFGNGITNVIASVAPSIPEKDIEMAHVSEASRAIRRALVSGLEEIPERLLQSRLGQPIPSASSMNSSSCFSTTSWRQLSPQDICFSPTASLVNFHGQPAHPLPKGKTFTSVIHSNVSQGGSTVELLIPSDQAKAARKMHSNLCELFLEWHADY